MKATTDWRSRAEAIAIGLLTLEVNTVSKSGMSAQKMPIVPVALHNIVDEYGDYLISHGYGVTECLWDLSDQRVAGAADAPSDKRMERWKPTDPVVDSKSLTNGATSFEALRWAANATLRDRLDIHWEERAKLLRIQANSRQLREVVRALEGRWAGKPALELLNVDFNTTIRVLLDNPDMTAPVDSDIAVLVRKAWDLGTATVLMQTTIQVDGDAVNFVSPEFPNGQQDFLLESHRRIVDVGLSQWKSLFQLAASLAGAVGEALFSRKV